MRRDEAVFVLTASDERNSGSQDNQEIRDDTGIHRYLVWRRDRIREGSPNSLQEDPAKWRWSRTLMVVNLGMDLTASQHNRSCSFLPRIVPCVCPGSPAAVGSRGISSNARSGLLRTEQLKHGETPVRREASFSAALLATVARPPTRIHRKSDPQSAISVVIRSPWSVAGQS